LKKEIRDKLGIVQGDKFVFDLKGDKIIIRKLSTNKLSEVLNNQKPWRIDSVKYQRQLRNEWE